MELLKTFWLEEDGVGVVEIVLIMVVLVGLVIFFRESVGAFVQETWDRVTAGGGEVTTDIGGAN